jgi:hypothetical protein
MIEWAGADLYEPRRGNISCGSVKRILLGKSKILLGNLPMAGLHAGESFAGMTPMIVVVKPSSSASTSSHWRLCRGFVLGRLMDELNSGW